MISQLVKLLSTLGLLVRNQYIPEDYLYDYVEHNLKKCSTRTYFLDYDATVHSVDAYSDIQKALNVIDTGTLVLGEGTFIVSNQISLSSNTCLVGQGIDKTVIKLKDNASEFRYSGLVRSINSENVTIMGLTLDGNRENQSGNETELYGRYGLFTEVTNYLYLNKVRITKNYGYGFDPHGNKTHWANYLIITNCQSDKNGFDGYALDQTNFITFFNNTAINNDRHGVNFITGSSKGYIGFNYFSKNGYEGGKGSSAGCGVVVQNNFGYGTNTAIVTNNILKDNHCEMFITDVENIVVKENFIKNDNSTCIKVVDSKGIQVLNNVCYSPMGVSLKSVKIKENNIVVKRFIKVDKYCLGGSQQDTNCMLSTCSTYSNLNCMSTNAACCPSLVELSGSMCKNSSIPCNM